MSTTRDLYAKLDSGLIIPKRLVPEPAKSEPPEIPKELFAKFRRRNRRNSRHSDMIIVVDAENASATTSSNVQFAVHLVPY